MIFQVKKELKQKLKQPGNAPIINFRNIKFQINKHKGLYNYFYRQEEKSTTKKQLSKTEIKDSCFCFMFYYLEPPPVPPPENPPPPPNDA